MHPPPWPRPRQRRYSVRHQTRLDAETNTKLEELARTFRRKRAAILRSVMQRGLTHTHTWTMDPSIPDRPYLVPRLLEPEVLQQVQEAAAAHGAIVAAWLRLDEAASRKLAAFMHTFERSAAEIIRQLIAQATPEDFPSGRQMIAHARRVREVLLDDDGLAQRYSSTGVDEAHAARQVDDLSCDRRS